MNRFVGISSKPISKNICRYSVRTFIRGWSVPQSTGVPSAFRLNCLNLMFFQDPSMIISEVRSIGNVKHNPNPQVIYMSSFFKKKLNKWENHGRNDSSKMKIPPPQQWWARPHPNNAKKDGINSAWIVEEISYLIHPFQGRDWTQVLWRDHTRCTFYHNREGKTKPHMTIYAYNNSTLIRKKHKGILFLN